ncbi:hypothetical protein KC717_00560 [Candidatus Dojkabacteria bacterium]|uniref:Glycosyltransferase 2-like domain-containing protein n=1 Tax=Candidatus Dojkabacteria bacterium TaxID=2099670 RepID=A0A955RJR4_9BACT|nr:hypothetical protein [Candidatus Dojkabacteria bacterium]
MPLIRRISLKYQHSVTRFFEILPGFFIWFLLTSPFWFAQRLSVVFGNLLIIFAVYWTYRAAIFLIGLIIGYRYHKKEIAIDWRKQIQALQPSSIPDLDILPSDSIFPKQLIVIPIGGAKYDILKHTLDAIDAQNYPKERIYVSLSFEERLIENDPEYFETMKNMIRKDFAHFGERLMIFDHPKDIPGEAIGAAANRTWGNKQAIKTLEEKGETIQDFITTSPDEDIRFDKEYLGAMSYRYIVSEKRLQKFYQTAVYLFSNNYWKVPSLIRAWSMSLSLPVLSSSVTHLHDRETWSCYSVNLQVMKDVNYWDTSIGIDDTPFFWRPFDHFNGDFHCETFFVPLYADAVYHPNAFTNYKAQYKQLVRWGWGVVAFPIAMNVLLQNEKIPFFVKLRKIFIMFEIIVLFKLAAILFTFAIPIIGLLNPQFNSLQVSSLLPQTLSLIMTFLTIMIIPSAIVKLLLMPEPPSDWSKFKVAISFLIEIPLQILLLFTYAFLPFIDGPTRMMLGHNYDFVVTQKK